jgi:hypothetical protein
MRGLITAGLLSAALAFAGVDGVVTNATTGKPQAGATVTLFQTSQAGPQFINSVKTDGQGKFVFTDDVSPGKGGGPLLLQAVYGGIQYNKMMPPGTPTAGVEIPVFESSKRPGEAKIDQHMILLEPSADGMLTVSESYVFRNDGKTAWNDPDNGTLQFALPAAAQGKVEVNALAPGGLPLRKAPDPGPKPNTFKLDFPIKPGESRVDLQWSMPFQVPGVFEDQILSKGGTTRMIAPVGVSFKGDGLKNLGEEPRTKATIWGVEGPVIKFTVEGTGSLSDPAANASGGGAGGGEASGSGQQSLSMVLPKLYGLTGGSADITTQILAVKWVLLSVLTMLALGFAVLYRRQETSEAAIAEPETNKKAAKNARGRS